jgi:hypothetical protein
MLRVSGQSHMHGPFFACGLVFHSLSSPLSVALFSVELMEDSEKKGKAVFGILFLTARGRERKTNNSSPENKFQV